MPRNDVNKSRWMLISSMLIFGTIGIFRKYIPLPSSVLAMARGWIGMAFLAAVLLLKRQKLNRKAIGRNFPCLLASGIMMGFNWILLFEAYRYTSVATATLCYYMAPIFVVLVSPMLLKERLSRKKLLCVGAALAGMVLVSGVTKAGFRGAEEWTGVLLGLGAAVLYAGVVLLNKFIRELNVYDKTIVQLGAAAVVLLPYTLLTEDFSQITFEPLAVGLLLVVGIVHTGIAYALYFGSLKDLPGQTVALFSYIDPVCAIILSSLLLQEAMGAAEGIGAVLVLCAALVSELPEREKPGRKA